MTKENFLLGKGERLVEDIIGARGGAPKQHPYTFLEARTRLTPMLDEVVLGIDQLPESACPDDQAVAMVTLNPEYIAKSYFPNKLFKILDFELVGSRPRRITPEKRSRGRQPEEAITTQLFVRGTRPSFREWRSKLPHWRENIAGVADLVTIEQVAAPTIRDKIKGKLPKSGETVLEVVLHADVKLGESDVLPLFRDYLITVGVDQKINYRFYAGGLCFVELATSVEFAETIATFTPVRALRQMPRLRMTRPNLHTSRVPTSAVQVSSLEPMDRNIRAAIFDGGLPNSHPLNTWAKPIEPTDVASPVADFQKHGVGVTSAFLFGHIDPAKPLSRPYASVDHYRVLDESTLYENPFELYRVLDRIDKILVEKEYDFINLSIGPQLPIEDDDVHAWTAVLDDRLSRGTTLATNAVGNDGEGDADDGLNRIQVPSDCVNALSVGACDSPETPWQRCSYSSVGPGRSPGPDQAGPSRVWRLPAATVHRSERERSAGTFHDRRHVCLSSFCLASCCGGKSPFWSKPKYPRHPRSTYTYDGDQRTRQPRCRPRPCRTITSRYSALQRRHNSDCLSGKNFPCPVHQGPHPSTCRYNTGQSEHNCNLMLYYGGGSASSWKLHARRAGSDVQTARQQAQERWSTSCQQQELFRQVTKRPYSRRFASRRLEVGELSPW